MTLLKMSIALMFVSALLQSNRANATVFTGSIVANVAVHADEINSLLQALVSLTTIGVGITTMIVARYNYKKMKNLVRWFRLR